MAEPAQVAYESTALGPRESVWNEICELGLQSYVADMEQRQALFFEFRRADGLHVAFLKKICTYYMTTFGPGEPSPHERAGVQIWMTSDGLSDLPQ